jgi:hypothetical protein
MLKPFMPVCLVLAGAILVAPAAAQQEAASVAQEGASLHFDAVGHRITMPLPDWLTAAERLAPNVVSLLESNTYADPKQAFVEFFPRGQRLENYETTYAARITREPGRSLEDYRRAAIFGYSQGCKPQATGMFTFGEDTDPVFPALAFICGAYLDSVAGYAGLGTVVVSVFRKTDAGIAMIYQEWRGPAFDPYDPAGWPVSAEAFQARAEEIQATAELLVAAQP